MKLNILRNKNYDFYLFGTFFNVLFARYET